MKRLIVKFLIILIVGRGSYIFCQGIPVLDLSQTIENPGNITLSNFIESIIYIPLATTYDCLVDKNPKVYVTKDYIIIITTYKCQIFSRKNGEFIREIGRYGRGPGEYQSTRGLFNELIPAYYFTGWNGQLIKYTMDGVFRGNIKIPGYNDSFESTSFPMNYSYFKDSVIVCDFLLATGTEPRSLMMFSEEGNVLNTVPNRNILKSKQRFTLRTGETSFYHFNNMLFFQSMYNDTVFHFSIDKVSPYLILNRGKHSPPFESRWWPYSLQTQSGFISQPEYFENERFISFNFQLSKNRYFALYNKPSKLLKVAHNNSGIENDIDGFINITFDSINSEGELIGLLQANELVSWIKKNPEKFKTLNPGIQKLKNVQMEDNPVIIIAKYKN